MGPSLIGDGNELRAREVGSAQIGLSMGPSLIGDGNRGLGPAMVASPVRSFNGAVPDWRRKPAP